MKGRSDPQPAAKRPRVQGQSSRPQAPAPSYVADLSVRPPRPGAGKGLTKGPGPAPAAAVEAGRAGEAEPYLGTTPKKQQSYVADKGILPKPLRDFYRAKSPAPPEGPSVLPDSVHYATVLMQRAWTPAQEQYLGHMDAQQNTLTAAVHCGRAMVHLLRSAEQSRASVQELQSGLQSSDAALAETKAELEKAQAKLKAAQKRHKERVDELEEAKADLSAEVEWLRAQPVSAGLSREEVIEEFKASEEYKFELDSTFVGAAEDLLADIVEKRPDWDIGFLREEVARLRAEYGLPEVQAEAGGEAGDLAEGEGQN